MHPTDRSTTLRIIGAGTALRLAVNAVLGLGIDEAYALGVSRHLSLSYFDHPPLGFTLGAVMAKLAGTEAAFVVRLPYVALFAASCWLLASLASRTFGPRAAPWTAFAANVAPVFALSSGGWVLPDGPLLFGLVLAATGLAHALLDGDAPRSPLEREPRAGAWLVAGFGFAIAFLSKYHTALVAAGAVVAVLTVPAFRARLAAPWPWLAMLIGLAGTLPALLWNARHGWVSFVFQSSRGAPMGFRPTALLQNLGGQLGYLLPWVWIPLAVVLVRALRAGPREPARWLVACLAAGPVLVFTLVALGGRPGLPHWPAPGWFLALPLLGAALAARGRRQPSTVRHWATVSAVAFVGLVAIAVSHVATGWAMRVAPSAFRRGDPGWELADWGGLREAVARETAARPVAFVGAARWLEGGKIAHALGPDVPVTTLSDDPRHFFYAEPSARFVGRDALLAWQLVPRDPTLTARRLADYGAWFDRVTIVDTVAITRRGARMFDVVLVRAERLRAPYPSPLPP